jgi:esterase/lipase superfamily enzyme
VLFGTARAPEAGSEPGAFGGDASDKVALGDAVVFVPGGSFSTDAWPKSSVPVPIPVGSATDAERLVIREKHVLAEAAIRERARAELGRARLYPGSALVFVQGLNVKFDAAVQRVAQLVRDLNFDGPAFVFSWPSKGSMYRYGTDRGSADRAAHLLAEFLGTVAHASGAKRIHVIAHSMGNRVLLPALVEVVGTPRNGAFERIGEVIMAAPAVPQREFGAAIDALAGRAKGLTLYASKTDKAMWAGFVRERLTVLAGYASDGKPLLHPSIASIDLTEAGVPGLLNLNHDVFAANPVMTEDMRALLQNGKRDPGKRVPTLKPCGKPPIYWSHTPVRCER